jgi:hypothetical protein
MVTFKKNNEDLVFLHLSVILNPERLASHYTHTSVTPFSHDRHTYTTPEVSTVFSPQYRHLSR